MRRAGSFLLSVLFAGCAATEPAKPSRSPAKVTSHAPTSLTRPAVRSRAVTPKRDVAERLAGLARRAKERPSPEYAPQYWICASHDLVLRLPDPGWRFGPTLDPIAGNETARPAPAFDALGRWVRSGDWDRVVERLDVLLGDEDPVVRAEARRRLCALPPPGLEVYEDFHGARAWVLLERGAADADPEPLEQLLARHPAAAAATRARELLLERRIERGELGAALALIDDPSGWPTASPETATALGRTRAWIAARIGVDPDAPAGCVTVSLGNDAARIVVTASRMEAGLDERETVRLLGAEEETRLVSARPGARLVRRERPVVGRPAWMCDVEGGAAPSTHAVVYRTQDGAVFRFTSSGAAFDLEAWLRRCARM